jgi:hypothetical protein
MYCAFCGHSIPPNLQGKSALLVGKGIENTSKKTYTFRFTLCGECSDKIDSHLKGGEEGALRREFEDKLYNEGCKPEEIEQKLRDFDTKTFGTPDGTVWK